MAAACHYSEPSPPKIKNQPNTEEKKEEEEEP